MSESSGIAGVIEFLIKTVIITAIFVGTSYIGMVAGPLLWIPWAFAYWYARSGVIQAATDAAAGKVCHPQAFLDCIPNLLMDGPIGSAQPDNMVFIYILIGATAIGLAGGVRWAYGVFCFWAPILLFPVWLSYIGAYHYYPGGQYAYFTDHWQQVCQRKPNGDLQLDANGREQCRYIMKKQPPF